EERIARLDGIAEVLEVGGADDARTECFAGTSLVKYFDLVRARAGQGRGPYIHGAVGGAATALEDRPLDRSGTVDVELHVAVCEASRRSAGQRTRRRGGVGGDK